jgi:hypothetical protein
VSPISVRVAQAVIQCEMRDTYRASHFFDMMRNERL